MLVYFWSSTSADAAEDFDALKQLTDRLAGRGLEVVYVNIDGDPAAAKTFLSGRLMAGTHLYQKGGLDGAIAERLRDSADASRLPCGPRRGRSALRASGSATRGGDCRPSPRWPLSAPRKTLRRAGGVSEENHYASLTPPALPSAASSSTGRFTAPTGSSSPVWLGRTPVPRVHTQPAPLRLAGLRRRQNLSHGPRRHGQRRLLGADVRVAGDESIAGPNLRLARHRQRSDLPARIQDALCDRRRRQIRASGVEFSAPREANTRRR